MRPSALRVGVGVILGLSVANCGADIDEKGAEELWKRIHDEGYRSWARAPGWETRQPTVSVHGQTADIFVNTVVQDASQTPGLTAWPANAVLVKDSFRDDELALIAALDKRPSGWFFAEWDAEGTVKFAGSPSVCIDCHQAAPDFVFSAVLP